MAFKKSKNFLVLLLVIISALCVMLGFSSCDFNTDDNSEKTTYTVTYDANGGAFGDGSETYTQMVIENSTLTAPASPTRENYTLVGWAMSKDGTTTWTFLTDTVSANITLYAIWKEKSALIISVNNASIDGFNIFMLVDSDNSFSLSSMITCSADSSWKLYQDELGQVEIPTRNTGVLSNGDNYFYIVVTSSDAATVNTYVLNVYLSYSVNVSFYVYYNNRTELLNTVTAKTGYMFTTNYTPEITGYTFNKWLDSSGKEFTSAILWNDTILIADKTVNSYTITFTVNSDETFLNTQQTVMYDTYYTLSVPQKTGYTFEGWYYGDIQLTDGEGNSISQWTYTQNIAISAKWTINTYNVAINSTGFDGGVVTGAGIYDYNTSVTITATTNSGYTWVGWYDAEGNLLTTEKSYSFVIGLEDVTYTAKWLTTTVTVLSNDINGGTVSGLTNENNVLGTLITVTATVNLGYTFLGWYNGDIKLSEDYVYSFTITEEKAEYIATYEMDSAISGFVFTSTPTICVISGIKDNTVTQIVVPNYVTSINCGAFSGCSSLVEITLPFVGDSVKTSKDTYQYPFGYIFGTTSYTGAEAINQSNYVISTTSSGTFSESTSVTYYIPSTLTTVKITGGDILQGAFFNCTLLTSIIIPSSATIIAEYAFKNCTSLKTIIIPDMVEILNSESFYNCTSLESIVIGNSLRSIGNHVFIQCSSLSNIIVNSGNITYKAIDGNLYSYDGKILVQYAVGKTETSFTIPKGVITIGKYAFYSCSILTKINIGNEVITIDDEAFYKCDSLTDITIGSEVTIIGDYAFRFCSSLKSVILPDKLTTLGAVVFSDCSSLESVILGSNLTSIGRFAFSGCKLLTSIIVPNSVSSIGEFAFDECSSLSNVTIGSGVLSIDIYAFYRCTALLNVYYASTVSEWNAISFENSYSNPTYYGATIYYYSNNDGTTTATGNYWYYDNDGNIKTWSV